MERSLHNFSVSGRKDSSVGFIGPRLVPDKFTRTEINSPVVKKKILYVDNRSQYFVTHRLPLAMAVRDRLAEVHVTTLSRREEDLELIASKGLVFHKLPHNSNGRSVVKPLLLGFELATLFKRLKPDLVHIFTLKAMCVGGLAFLGVDKSAVLMTVTGLGYAFTSRTIKARLLGTAVSAIMPPLFKRAGDDFIFQNQDDLTVFHDQFRIARERLHLIRGSGVDIRNYPVLAEKPTVPTIILVSRMLRDKGVTEFVEAARSLKLEGIQARFLLVGDPDAENPAGIPASELLEWHDSGVVEWQRYCSDIRTLFSDAHIVCLPSYREGIPKVLMEAAACGRPIVTTDAPGCREVVRHQENGLLVPPRDGHALASALRTLIRDSELRLSMGRNGRSLAENEFSLERVIKENFKLYERILDN
jgi:glycosyltransferase involved in cell wall biosynthesis